MNAPIVLRIPYDEAALAANGIPESALQVWRIPYDAQGMATWEPVESYVVDAESDQVVIFADRMGSYALRAAVVRWRIFLPLVMR